MKKIKCPLCEGEVGLQSQSSTCSQEGFSREFGLKCSQCGLTSREVSVFTTVNRDGRVESHSEMLNDLLKEWG